jgi:CIC family chloride channel protein
LFEESILPIVPNQAPSPHPWLRLFRPGETGTAVLIALPIGVLAALVTSLFRWAIDWCDTWLFGSHADITVVMAHLPWGWVLAVPALGGLLAGLPLWWEQRRGVEGGAKDYMDAVTEGDGRIPIQSSLVRSLSSLASIVSAGSIGREGAMVQLAALTGSLSGGRWADTATLRLTTACGAAAGLASVYHTPLAGAMFVAEIVLGSITVDRLIPLFAASVAASFTMHALGNQGAPFALVHSGLALNHADLVLLLPIGLAAGLLAPPFLALLDISRHAFRALSWPLPLRMLAGGLAMGAIAVAVPEVCGNGYAPITAILHGEALSVPLAVVLVAKVAATALIVGSGAVGGIFTPSLFIGAALGSLLAGAALWFPSLPYPDAALLALVGMGAFMAAVSHAPLMAILMVFEMTMDATLLLPLMSGCVIAYTVSRAFRSHSLYAVLNRRHVKLSEVRRLDEATLADLVEPVADNLAPDTTLAEARAMFERMGTRYLYALDEAGGFIGALSLHRLSEQLYRYPDKAGAPVRELIDESFQLLAADCRLPEAWQAFMKTPLERIPVVDDLQHKHLLGVVTKRGLLERIQCLRD